MPPHFFSPAHGEQLHHYTSLAGAAGVLRSNRLWLSDFARMNDAREYHYAKEAYLAAYRNRPVWVEEVPRLIASFSLAALEANTNMFIGCFCSDPDDPHLWGNYAANGAGCVLTFDAQCIVDHLGVAVRRVVYDPSELERFVHAGLDMLQQQFSQAPDDRTSLADLAKFFLSDLYAFKEPRWAKEREVRVSRLLVRDGAVPDGLRDVGGHAADLAATPSCPVKFRPGAFGETAYIELPLTPGGHPALRGITLGPRVTTHDAEMLAGLDPIRTGRVSLRAL